MKVRALIFAAMLAVVPTPVNAQSPSVCDKIEAHTEYLAREFGERIVFRGIASNGVEVVLFANTEKGTWTLFRLVDGVACFVVSGENGKVAALGGAVLRPANEVQF